MKYKYKSFEQAACDDDGNPLIYPIVNATLKHGRKRLNIDCLVDSGASQSLFPLDIAVILGVDLAHAPMQEYEGIGKLVVHGFTGTIDVKLSGFDEWVNIQAGFADINEMPLLGHLGFFEHYEITFRASQKKFEIKSLPRSRRPRRRRN